MFAFARLRLPDADLAEEAVQEALVSAWRSRGSFAGRSTERTWLIGILRYKVLDLLRERSRHAARGQGTARDTPAAGAATAESAAPGNTTPDDPEGCADFGQIPASDQPGRFANRASGGAWYERLAEDPDHDTIRRAVERALSELPEPMRTALVLREVDGVS